MNETISPALGASLREMASRLEGWNPIETAPKDGSAVLVYGVPHGEDGRPLDEAQPVVASCFEGGKWWVCATDYEGISVAATHWMTLPEPPAALSPSGSQPSGRSSLTQTGGEE